MSQQSMITVVITRIAKEFKAVRSDLGGQKIVKLKQSEYQALAVKDPKTLYFLDWDE